MTDIDSDDEYDTDSDNEFQESGGAAPVAKVDPRTRTTIRNLRIREDTAKYLRNLDINSAYYDPKTRSMRGNPYPNANPEEQVYAGDNFVRQTGDAQEFNDLQCYSWEAYEKGQDIHMQSAPSQAELLHKEFTTKKDILRDKLKSSIVEKYGGEEHLQAPPKELLLAQTEHYVEYSRDGKIVKGQEKAIAKSKYEEDVLINNHTSAWGSYWEEGQWGYACCHAVVKNSYCLGASNIQARKVNVVQTELVEMFERKKLESKPKDIDTEKETKDSEKRFKAALKAEEKRKKEIIGDDRKRSYNSFKADSNEITEEEMEAYHLKKVRREDPMSNFIE